MTKRLIEEWLPIADLGEESVRERRSMTALPPTYYLHVWWARRPLVASRAAVLASLLPADTETSEFTRVLGIKGTPALTKKKITIAKRTGKDLGTDPYGYKRAFLYHPSKSEEAWLQDEATRIGIDKPIVLDPTAGGGSIPFEALRSGFETLANDLNPVAGLILKATVDWPQRYGLEVRRIFDDISQTFIREVETRLDGVFSSESNNTQVLGYLWSRTVTCPYCDGLIPLSPNWRLAPDGTGVRLKPHTSAGERFCSFEIVRSLKDHSPGTVARGDAICPYPDCGRVVDGDEIKRQAQAGQMGDQLYAIAFKERVVGTTKTGRKRDKWERGYRAPRPEDDNAEELRRLVAEKMPEWEALDIVPTEAVPRDINDDRPIQYGMPLWRDLFSPRQLLGHCTAVEVFRELLQETEARGALDDATKAAFGYLALSLDKMRDYNSRMSVWHAIRGVITNTFSQHDFSFKWSYAELPIAVVGSGLEWVTDQTAKCIGELVDLTRPDIDVKAALKNGGQPGLWSQGNFTPPPVTITCKPADNLDHIADASVDVVVMDPPYYDNVMYSELSDFFYVWLKRTAGHVYPELFRRQLTDKESEAVANPARFNGQKGAKMLAYRDYRDRMAAIFAECRRVLKPDGVMTLMFTHKATGAWDALTTGLMEAGFVITASWPVNTEAEGSMHIKDKSAANSTIFLVCRPRLERGKDEEDIYWEDLEPLVQRAVRSRIASFQEAGIRGVDLYLSAFGPALEEFSRHWPVKRGRPRERPAQLRRRAQMEMFEEEFDPYAATPEDALDAARGEVKRWRLEQLTNTQRKGDLDPLTEWFVLAWDAFQAPRFPYDEALRLARVVGIDMDRQVIGHVAEKQASDVILWDSATRAAKGGLGPANGSESMLDALHHAANLARKQSLAAAREVLEHVGLIGEPSFRRALELVLEVLPPSRGFTGFDPVKAAEGSASDFEMLENLRRLAFKDQIDEPEQLSLLREEEVAL